MTRILLADDEPTILEVLAELLRDEGYDVVGTTTDGVTALDAARELRPDVLIIDHDMPKLNGLDVARSLHDAAVPVIIFSAYDDAGLQIEAERAAVAAYLVKGCSSRLIVKAIEDAVSGRSGGRASAG
jgi:DNA-binding NarL/FixJ family response regulator